MMAKPKNNELEELRLFVASLMNREQKDHSKLVCELKAKLGLTHECITTTAVLGQILDAKDKILQEIFNKIKSLQ
jgi:hypothetical protein